MMGMDVNREKRGGGGQRIARKWKGRMKVESGAREREEEKRCYCIVFIAVLVNE